MVEYGSKSGKNPSFDNRSSTAVKVVKIYLLAFGRVLSLFTGEYIGSVLVSLFIKVWVTVVLDLPFREA